VADSKQRPPAGRAGRRPSRPRRNAPSRSASASRSSRASASGGRTVSQRLRAPRPGGEPPWLARPEIEEELEGAKTGASVAGRILAIRDFGKAAFVRIRDRSGAIQLFVQRDKLGPDGYAKYKELDVGDIVFAEGTLFKTKTNELSVDCDRLELVTKSLQPMPRSTTGLADVEIRYRQRYLDLIMSEESREVFRKRSRIIEEIRRFFTELDFLEVETPMMHPIVGGATARPFVTTTIPSICSSTCASPPNCTSSGSWSAASNAFFEINRNFRNEGVSIKHNPEFTMLEFYQSYATYEDLMDLTERLFRRVAEKVLGSTTITYQGTKIDLGRPWERISVEDAIIQHTGFTDRSKLRDRAALLEYGKRKACR